MNNPAATLAQERFLDFYRELVAVTALARTASEGDSQASTLFARLRGVIAEQSLGSDNGGRSDEVYVMAALADEVMLTTEWPGRVWWESHLLEEALFGSRISGERVFSLAQSIANDQMPGRTDLAVAILLTLSLGFRGRFLGVPDHGAIDHLRRKLFETVYLRPLPSSIDWSTALPGAPLPIIDIGPMPRPPTPRPWLLGIAASLALYVMIAHLLWSSATKPVLDRADAVVLSAVRN